METEQTLQLLPAGFFGADRIVQESKRSQLSFMHLRDVPLQTLLFNHPIENVPTEQSRRVWNAYSIFDES